VKEPSPSSFQAASRAWFARTFVRSCSCEGLDVRFERGKFECGKCGAPIQPVEPCGVR
jgi:hypothetical protein